VPALHPSGALAANIDMGERTSGSAGVIEASPANKIGVLALDALDCRENDSRIGKVHSTVAIQVVHPPVAVIVDDDVGSVTELMPTVARAATLIPESKVVVRGPEA